MIVSWFLSLIHYDVKWWWSGNLINAQMSVLNDSWIYFKYLDPSLMLISCPSRPAQTCQFLIRRTLLLNVIKCTQRFEFHLNALRTDFSSSLEQVQINCQNMKNTNMNYLKMYTYTVYSIHCILYSVIHWVYTL